MQPRVPSELDPAVASRLKRDASGLVVAVVQQHDTGEVLMVGWMDDEALHRTLTTGRATYWSRSRREYWVKGDTSGHVQHVESVALDCDGDSLLVRVDQDRPGDATFDKQLTKDRARDARAKDADTRALERRLSDSLGLEVVIDDKGGKGTLSIKYKDLDQLDAVLRKLGAG